MTQEQLVETMRSLQVDEYRARQVSEWMYRHDCASTDEMKNLPMSLRTRLAAHPLRWSDPEPAGESSDGTRKYTWPSFGGDVYESAVIPDRNRVTLCVSSQAGCRIGCKFCLTARKGLRQNLSPAEILSQYARTPERENITHFVFMGMGEPLDNFDHVLSSVQVLTEKWGYGFSSRRVTVSTVGLLPHLERLLDETDVNVAVSIHAARREVRLPLVPSENQHPASAIADLLRQRAKLSLPPFTGTGRRRLSFELTMIDGMNDSERHAADLRDLIEGIPARVNLIPWNSFPGTSFRPSPRENILKFQALLKRSGIVTTVRRPRGQDIGAACGLLAGRRDVPD
jgi:23S rRNA (adenine2503-C2)-methyltransferase